MDLLLKINKERRTTCVMVTHNPDLEVGEVLRYCPSGSCVRRPLTCPSPRLCLPPSPPPFFFAQCYADRVVYMEDGRLVTQAINSAQTPLHFESYLAYLNSDT
jgi:putative ABC transport system ATP-binding protein